MYQNIICIFVCLWTALQPLQKFNPDRMIFLIIIYLFTTSYNTEICEVGRAAFCVSQNNHFKQEKQILTLVCFYQQYITCLQHSRHITFPCILAKSWAKFILITNALNQQSILLLLQGKNACSTLAFKSHRIQWSSQSWYSGKIEGEALFRSCSFFAFSIAFS